MAVLSDVDIEKIVSDNKGIIIMNMHENNLTAPGYDFTIGFICNANSGEVPEKIEYIRDTKSDREYKKDEFFENCQLKENFKKNKEDKRFKFGYRYELKPGERYLVISEEYIFLSKKYMATLHSRGSYALKGIIVSSTTIDPNYRGFIYASLINCSKNPVYIKEDNQFATMVIHTLTTATDKPLPTTEGGRPKDAEQTLNGGFSNISEEVTTAAIAYRADAWKKIERGFQEKYAAYESSSSNKTRVVGWFFKSLKFLSAKVFSKGKFWMGFFLAGLYLYHAYKTGRIDIDKAFEWIQAIWK